VRGREKARSSPYVILREEFDDWAILFDPDTGEAFCLNPVGVHVWKLLDGEHSVDEMVAAVRRDAREVPQEAREHLIAFLQELIEHGLAGYVIEQPHDIKGRTRTRPNRLTKDVSGGTQASGQRGGGLLPYEQPRLETFGTHSRAYGGNCASGSNQISGPARPGLVLAALPVVSSTMAARPASLQPRAAMAATILGPATLALEARNGESRPSEIDALATQTEAGNPSGWHVATDGERYVLSS
jgi:SynChlorMet cassette protein ScmD